MNSFVLRGLVARRAERKGEIDAMHDKLRQLVMDLEALDGAILQFDPNYRIESIWPKVFRPPED